MEEKFERLKEEHEETLMKHEVAVMNAKAKSADIVEDAAKLLREEQKKNQLYRTEMQEMEKRLREERANMAATKSSTRIDTVVTESDPPKLLKSTSPKVNKYSSPQKKSPSPKTSDQKASSPARVEEKSAAEIEKDEELRKEKLKEIRMQEKRKIEAARK